MSEERMKFCFRIMFSLTFVLLLFGCSKTIPKERIFIPKKEPIKEMKQEGLPNRQTLSNKLNLPNLPLKSPPNSKVDDRVLIVIDAGHGGKDDGTQSHTYPICLEKTMTLSTAKMLDIFLQSMGYRTIMTRNHDVFIGLSERAKFANDKNSKLFLSVHYNAAENRKASGIEVYYYNTDSDFKRSKDSKKLATLVLDGVITNTKGKSRGAKHGNFAVIRETKMPAIIVEGGFMTNDAEMEKIRDKNYTKKIAWGIAQGVRKYLNGMDL